MRRVPAALYASAGLIRGADVASCSTASGRGYAKNSMGDPWTPGDERGDKSGKPTTPWARQVVSGVDLMAHPKFNKGLAFSDMERDRLYIRGLLPSAILGQEAQLERIMLKIRNQASPLEAYNYMLNLQERNEHLFYRVLQTHFEEVFDIVYRPTVQQACLQSSLMFRSIPRALFITPEDRGSITRILKNWPERYVNLIVVSDGECFGSIGDVGVHAIRSPISKLSMYTACGGVAPSECLPVIIDAGTDNHRLLRSPFYVGVRQPRLRGDKYYELMDEFMRAVKERYGNTTLIHFDNMVYENATQLLSMYRSEFPCFDDETSGTGSAVLAAVLAGTRRTDATSLADHTFMFSSNDASGATTAELFATAIAAATGLNILEARSRIWLVDGEGLVTRERGDNSRHGWHQMSFSHTDNKVKRGDSSRLEWHKLPFCHSGPVAGDLLSAVKAIKPTVLVGLSSSGRPPFKFTREVCEAVAENCRTPIILPLSQGPEVEATPADVIAWTRGAALTASDSRVDLITYPPDAPSSEVSVPADASPAQQRQHAQEQQQAQQQFVIEPSMVSSIYIYPGVGMGQMLARGTAVRTEQFVVAAHEVARLVTDDDLAAGRVLPPLARIREVGTAVAFVVAAKAYAGGYATALPKPKNLLDEVERQQYSPAYRVYR
ncbi:hypothetical protein FOA52_014054 [Chlamydomonas sp. UWO 241]|nr:hypothetical protein FOA52_014054 [Chlamydomonas sp. UWO 241]